MRTQVLCSAGFLALAHYASCEIAPTRTFDYVIVGGGTSGLVLANRLSEDPKVSVAIIEAGDSVFNNPNVTNTTAEGLSLGTSIDWQYTTTPQVYGGYRTMTFHAGKALGGSSTINGMVFIRPADSQVDLWEKIGNRGWNWSTIFTHSKLSERFTPPTPYQAALGAAYNSSYHGFTGHIGVGWSSTLQNDDAHVVIKDTWANFGAPHVKDINGGKLRGFSVFPSTLKDDVRQDSARAYFWPIAAERSNLKAFTNSIATRILWKQNTHKTELAVAIGVEIVGVEGIRSVISAAREVILSTGTLRSPALLELSGIGNPRILKQYSIPLVLELPSVGENLQDQTNNAIAATANYSWGGHLWNVNASFVSYLSAQDLFGIKTAALEKYTRRQIPNYASLIARNSNGALNATVQEYLLTTQADLIFNRDIPIVEILSSPANGAIAFSFWTLIPFTRGSVHISSQDPLAQPAINPNYFGIDLDVTIQAEAAKACRKVLKTSPLSQYVFTEQIPGLNNVPADADENTWDNWVKSSYTSNLHPVGTCAMLPRELGGVVDHELRVYGTKNVRVVDASVLPFQICGHPTSALYAIAERAAEIIKQTHS